MISQAAAGEQIGARLHTANSLRRAEAVAFYGMAFGARVLHQVGEGDEIVAQLAVGDAAFCVSPGGAEGPRFSPRAIGGATGRTLLMVNDPDAVFATAIRAGASAASEMADEHGWRLAADRQPGHNRSGRSERRSRPDLPKRARIDMLFLCLSTNSL